jgi:FAD/FMN-containing dehydrogenase
MHVKRELSKIVGAENVSDSLETLQAYSTDYSIKKPGLPNYVLWAKNSEEIQAIMRLANKRKIPVIPSSSRSHFHGATIPKQGGIILDMSRMNRILAFNEADGCVQIEPGVTWEQLQRVLGEKGFRCVNPLLPHASKSVLTSFLEREYPVISFFEYGDPLQSMGVVWPNGESYTTGSASILNFGRPGCLASGANPQGPGSIDFYRLFKGAQGTMGIVTWAIVKYEPKTTMDKTFIIPASRVSETVEPLYMIGRRKIGYECLVLNSLNLALILSENSTDSFRHLMEILPPWTVILVLGGLHRRPEEKIQYEEEALREIKSSVFPYLDLLTSIPGLPRAERKIPETLRYSWPKDRPYWKHSYKGSCQDLFFITTVDKVPQFVEAVSEQVADYEYPVRDLGCYIQPIEDSRACHCEFNLYYDSDDENSVERIRALYKETAKMLLDMGAVFSRPYGMLAELVYSRASGYTSALKRFKSIVDPNNILCPDNLCF